MTEIVKNSALYKAAYGAWTGFPKGHAPDYSRCCVEIWSSERWSRASQCSKKRGHGPDGAYCKQHDPAVAKARREASDARSKKQWNERRYETYGRTFFNTLAKIADGHNDARGLAQETIANFKSGEYR
jgi:hypothetical protein